MGERKQSLEASNQELKELNQRLAESERRYREIFENSPAGVVLLEVTPDLRFRVLDVNPIVGKITGVASTEAVGRFVEELVPLQTGRALTELYRRCVEAGTPISAQKFLEFPAGWKTYYTTVVPLRDPTGRIHRLLAMPTDVTEQRRMEGALRESEERYRQVFETTSDGIFLIDVTEDGRFRAAAYNPAMEQMMGVTNAQVAGKYNDDFLPPEVAEVAAANNRRCLEAGSAISFDETIELPNGRTFWRTTLVPVRDETGRISRIIGVTHDVTESARIRQALEQSEEKFSKAFHASPDSIVISRPEDGVLVDVNQGFTEAYGYSREEAIGHSLLPGDLGIWQTAEDRERLTALIAQRGEATGFETRFRRNDGQLRYFVLSSRLVEIDGKPYLLSISRDTTERRRMEEALRESELRYREIFENTSDGIFVVEVTPDLRYRLIAYNPAQEKMLGVSFAEAVGKFTSEYLPPDLNRRAEEDNRRCIEAGLPMSFEESYDLPGGPSVYYTTIVPVRDSSGRIARLIGVTRDMTERRRMEQREREHEQQLFQAAKLASLGTLVSGIAHEINNPNNFIRLNSQNLREFWQDVREILDRAASSEGTLPMHGIPYQTARGMIDDLLAGIEEGSKRIEKLLLNLRDYARRDEGDLTEQVDLNQVIGSAVMITRNLVGKSTSSFSLCPASSLPPVRGNYHQLEQVVINLITNACQSLRSPDGAVTVSTTVEPDGGWVRLEVADEGVGIPEENLSRITDPFFTTKRGQGGSGLGLAVSSRIVQNHGGSMRFTSREDRGTVAAVLLPVSGGST